MSKELSAGAVIFKKESGKRYYLLLHYNAGHWGFPKGHIEDGEDEIKTIRREVEEETGIKDIEIISGFKEYARYSFRHTYDLKKSQKDEIKWIFKTVIFHLAETKTKKIKLSYEHTDYKWLTYNKALEQLNYKSAKDILKKADRFF